MRLHGSDNVLYPTLLPFISDVADAVKARLARPSAPSPVIQQTAPPSDEESAPAGFVTPQAISNMHTTVSLRIDDSTLVLSCEFEARVKAELEWRSGGFMFMMTPGTRQVSAIANVNEVTIKLAHIHAVGDSSDALRATLKGVTISLHLQNPTAIESESGMKERRTMSLVVNVPGILAKVNTRQLQDALIFKRVWIDRLEAMQPDAVEAPMRSRAKSSPPPQSSSAALIDYLVAVQIDAIDLAASLGSQAGEVKARFAHLVSRYHKVPLEVTTASLSFQSVGLTSQGLVGSIIELGTSGFETSVHDQDGRGSRSKGVLSIQIHLGTLLTKIDLKSRRQFLAEIEPINIAVTDDWSNAVSAALHLVFDVRLQGIRTIATAESVAELIQVAAKIERALEDIAANANEGMNTTHSVVPPGARRRAVNVVAERMSTAKGAAAILGIKSPRAPRISGSLHLDLKRVCIGVFARSFTCV